DNLLDEGFALSEELHLSDAQVHGLRALGETLAYNAYGDIESDLIADPASLYRTLHGYADPFEFMRAEPLYRTIDESRRGDLQRAHAVEPSVKHSCAT